MTLIPVKYLKMVNVYRQSRTFCKKNIVHKLHNERQYKKTAERLAANGKRRFGRNQRGFGGQRKHIFHEKAKTTGDCKCRKQISLLRCKHFEHREDNKRKGKMIQF